MVRLTDRPDMILDVYRGRKTTMQQASFEYLYRADVDIAHHYALSVKRCT